MNALSKALAQDLAQLVEPLIEKAVRSAFPKPPAEGTPGKGWLTNAEAMEYLNLSRPTLARYRKSGLLPFSKVGSSVFYRLKDVEALLETNLVSTVRSARPKASSLHGSGGGSRRSS